MYRLTPDETVQLRRDTYDNLLAELRYLRARTEDLEDRSQITRAETSGLRAFRFVFTLGFLFVLFRLALWFWT